MQPTRDAIRPNDSASPATSRSAGVMHGALRGLDFASGEAALAPVQKKTAAGDADPYQNAAFDVTATLGQYHQIDTTIEGVEMEDEPAFLAMLKEKWPESTPLHELPYPMDLTVINRYWQSSGDANGPILRAEGSWAEKTASGKLTCTDGPPSAVLEYEKTPARISDLIAMR